MRSRLPVVGERGVPGGRDKAPDVADAVPDGTDVAQVEAVYAVLRPKAAHVEVLYASWTAPYGMVGYLEEGRNTVALDIVGLLEDGGSHRTTRLQQGHWPHGIVGDR